MSATLNTIPASEIVSVVPGVIAAGGSALNLNELALSSGTRVPIGSVVSFPSAAAVTSYFGANSVESAAGTVYFNGFNGATTLPAAMLFAQYPTANVGAYLRGGNVSSLTLAQLQAISGVLTVTIDGTVDTSSTISLTGATSFSNAAEIITTALGTTGPTQAVVTGAISGTTMTVTAVTSGTLAIGQQITGAGITGTTYISAFGTGTGGDGTYTLTNSQTASSETLTALLPTVTFDTISGGFLVVSGTTGSASTISYGSGTIAAPLMLTQATGAVTSQGAAAAVPGTFMTSIVALTQNWATFQTLFDPDNGSGNTQKQAFAAWVNGQNNRYAYLCTDTDITPTESTDAPACLGQILKAADSSGTAISYEPVGASLHLSTFLGSIAASTNFNATNGRTTAAFRSQSGLAPSVTNGTVATNLIANGYNFYGAYATASQGFDFFYPGQISGPYLWFDSYINQIWLNAQCQQAMLTLLTQIGSIPYNPVGYGYIRNALTAGATASPISLPPQSPVAAAINNGVIRQNVPLSSTEVQAVNALAGTAIDGTLSTVGWYLVIQPATAQVRAARQSPTIILLYMDGQSVQRLNLSSVLVQ